VATQVSAATIVLLLGDASETERPSLERTQQRIELLEKTANFHCMKRDTIAALRW
jgi:hypothetical protein